MGLQIEIDDPDAADVRDLLAAHLTHARTSTPSEFSFALEGEQLRDDDVTFFSARDDGELLSVAALKRLDNRHVELKSMHTRSEARGRGVGRALVEHLTDFARTAGYERISLETGTSDAFVPAHALYASCGFESCEPFGGYIASPHNTFMTKALG
jgi:putative acetyltransferase